MMQIGNAQFKKNSTMSFHSMLLLVSNLMKTVIDTDGRIIITLLLSKCFNIFSEGISNSPIGVAALFQV